jgi:hypothetical protein
MWMAIAVPLLVGGLALAMQQVEERLDRGVAEARVHRVPKGVPRTSAGSNGHRRALVADGAPGLRRTTSSVPVGRAAGHGSMTP